MRILWACLGLLTASEVWAGPNKIRISVFDSGAGFDHEKKILKILKSHLASCRSCEVRSFPIYEKDGTLRVSGFLSALKKGAQGAQILHFSWNIPAIPKTEPIVQALNDLSRQGKIIVASAGENYENRHRILKLSGTVMGKVQGALIIGELDPRGYLSPRSFYGDEMLTALAPPEGNSGSSFSAVLFTAELAKALTTADTKTVVERVQTAKKKNTTLYPKLEDLFQTGR